MGIFVRKGGGMVIGVVLKGYGVVCGVGLVLCVVVGWDWRGGVGVMWGLCYVGR